MKIKPEPDLVVKQEEIDLPDAEIKQERDTSPDISKLDDLDDLKQENIKPELALTPVIKPERDISPSDIKRELLKHEDIKPEPDAFPVKLECFKADSNATVPANLKHESPPDPPTLDTPLPSSGTSATAKQLRRARRQKQLRDSETPAQKQRNKENKQKKKVENRKREQKQLRKAEHRKQQPLKGPQQLIPTPQQPPTPMPPAQHPAAPRPLIRPPVRPPVRFNTYDYTAAAQSRGAGRGRGGEPYRPPNSLNPPPRPPQAAYRGHASQPGAYRGRGLARGRGQPYRPPPGGRPTQPQLPRAQLCAPRAAPVQDPTPLPAVPAPGINPDEIQLGDSDVEMGGTSEHVGVSRVLHHRKRTTARIDPQGDSDSDIRGSTRRRRITLQSEMYTDWAPESPGRRCMDSVDSDTGSESDPESDVVPTKRPRRRAQPALVAQASDSPGTNIDILTATGRRNRRPIVVDSDSESDVAFVAMNTTVISVESDDDSDVCVISHSVINGGANRAEPINLDNTTIVDDDDPIAASVPDTIDLTTHSDVEYSTTAILDFAQMEATYQVLRSFRSSTGDVGSSEGLEVEVEVQGGIGEPDRDESVSTC